MAHVPRCVVAAAALLACVASAARAATVLPMSVFAHTGVRLTDVVWTGSRFLYVENTTNTVYAAGSPPSKFASMPRHVEQTRCVASPGAHGFPAGVVYCHSPDNIVYAIRPDGTVSTFATLPVRTTSDGALAFDTVGAFGYRLIAATGRSGNPSPGGTVYAVDAGGHVTTIGSYAAHGGGGADELVVAPARFGSAAGQVVLTVDAGKVGGALITMDAHGRTRQIASLPDGPNPIVVVPATPGRGRLPVALGLYVTDTNSTNVFFTPDAALRRYAGDLVVGTEIGASFWVVAPHGTGFRTRRIPLSPPGSNFNLEGATYVN